MTLTMVPDSDLVGTIIAHPGDGVSAGGMDIVIITTPGDIPIITHTGITGGITDLTTIPPTG